MKRIWIILLLIGLIIPIVLAENEQTVEPTNTKIIIKPDRLMTLEGKAAQIITLNDDQGEIVATLVDEEGLVYLFTNRGHSILLNSNGQIVSDAQTGLTLKTQQALQSKNGSVYLSDSQKTYAFFKDGRVRYTYETPFIHYAQAYDGTVVLLSQSGHLMATDINGEILWQITLEGAFSNGLCIGINKTTIAISDGGRFYIVKSTSEMAFEKEKELNIKQTKFISLASHEFKTPLSGILPSAGLIEKYNDKLANKKIAKHVATIKMLVIQLNNILDDFLFLENTESENYTLHLSKFKFCDLVNKLAKDAEAILKEGQRIEITPCKSTIEVYQDRKIIDIIIKNVLYNAIKYSSEHSVIWMKIKSNDLVEVSIEDQGIGIPTEAMAHIFERFYRAKNALPIQGTGIGLNIAKRYLDKLNGSINVQSAELKGTKVLVKLPIDYKKSETKVY
jgi:signal transduction histidine kinase